MTWRHLMPYGPSPSVLFAACRGAVWGGASLLVTKLLGLW